MPADPELLPILAEIEDARGAWQVTAIGRAEICRCTSAAPISGGHLRSGLEDTFYLRRRHQGDVNGQLVERARACASARARDREPGGARGDFWSQH